MKERRTKMVRRRVMEDTDRGYRGKIWLLKIRVQSADNE
jgi:hypothetical protein